MSLQAPANPAHGIGMVSLRMPGLRMLGATCAAAVTFWEPLAGYARDNHYQTHFLFLWAFFGAAALRAGRGRAGMRAVRGARVGLALAITVLALLLWHAGLATGSSTAQRLTIVFAFTAWALAGAAGWGIRRCLAYGAFALLCFGLPYSAYFQVTHAFRALLVRVLEVLPSVTPLDYRVDGLALQFDGFRLAITDDCSGFQQVLTFFGLALVGILTGRAGPRRVLGLLALGAVLAGVSNLARVLLFVGLVAGRQYQFVHDPDLHAWAGLAVYAPFLAGFIVWILRTHRPLPSTRVERGRGLWIPWLLLPFLALRVWHLPEPGPVLETPGYFASLGIPPGYAVAQRAPTEEHEKRAYDTPWLVNVMCSGGGGRSLELFAYVTRSPGHLGVHQISNCLDVPGTEVRYGPAVEVGGRTFWTLELIGDKARHHGYFAFWVDGEDRDDKLGTQMAVFGKRLWSGLREVGLTRFLLPGPLVLPLPAEDEALLAWRARALEAASRPEAGLAGRQPGG